MVNLIGNRSNSAGAASRSSLRSLSEVGSLAGVIAHAAGRRALTGFRNNERMPLICPTCQIALWNVGGRLLLCMGLFSIFWERAPSQGSAGRNLLNVLF